MLWSLFKWQAGCLGDLLKKGVAEVDNGVEGYLFSTGSRESIPDFLCWRLVQKAITYHLSPTQNFNGLTQSFDGFGTSENKILTERFARIGPRTINYEFTIDDPSTFSDKLSAIVPMTKVESQLYEYACHEGNYGMANMLRGARRKDANAVTDRVADLFRGL